jgi:hypothetical protein
VLFARLILIQSGSILVVTDECKLEVFAPFDGVCDGRSSDDEPIVLDARQVFELLQFSDKGCLVFLGNIVPEAEENLLS